MSDKATNPTARAPLSVSADEAEMRVDRWFKRHFPDVSHGQIEKGLRTGQIRVGGKRAGASDRLEEGQTIRVPPPFYTTDSMGQTNKASLVLKRQSAMAEGQKSKLRSMVLFQDDDVIVLNKPAGLAVQGGTGLRENLDDSLAVFATTDGSKPKLVHRLDRDTSGVLLVARTDYAARQLSAAFRERETKKIYWALTLGVPDEDAGQIDAALIKIGEKMKIAETKAEIEESKSATSLFRVVERVPKKVAFVALWPWTGRTHQLRIHMAHLGTPILGDRLYGGMESDVLPLSELGRGLHLHARRIVVPHPRRGMIDITAPLGNEMHKSWRWFGFDADDKTDFEEEA